MFCYTPVQISISGCLSSCKFLSASLIHAADDALNLVDDRVQVGIVWRPQTGSDEVGGLMLQLLNGITGVMGMSIMLDLVIVFGVNQL